jgi:general stress protein 26
MKRTILPAELVGLLDTVRYVSVATVNPDGLPWNTPVAAYFDDNLNMYWASWTGNRHSKNIARNGQAVSVVFDSTPATPATEGKGLYLQQSVHCITDKKELAEALEVYGDRLDNSGRLADFSGKRPRRIYKAEPLAVWTNTDSAVKGRFVDKRKRIC